MRQITDEECYTAINEFLKVHNQTLWQKIESAADGFEKWVQGNESYTR